MEGTERHDGPTGAGRARDVHRGYAKGVGSAVLLMIGFALGAVITELREGQQPRTPTPIVVNRDVQGNPELPAEIDFKQFWDVWELVKSRNVDQKATDVDLFYGALEGMVGALGDPYSVYFDPEFAEQFAADLAGTFEGIGAEIGIKQDQLMVIAPLDGTPASKAGLRSGDHIVAIDGEDTYGMTIEEAVRRIRGEKGTTVTLLIWRAGAEEATDHVITRETIVVESVTWHVEERDGKRFGVIEMNQFNETTEPRFQTAVQELLLEGLDGLVLDLRNNPGGFLDTAVKVAGEWVQQDLIVAEKFSDGTVRNYLSEGTARFGEIPTVVLVNGGSASASEIVAGALQDHGKADIIGTQTYGKGSVQDYMEFDDGSALKLTIALWFTPLGRSIAEEGISPDEIVEYATEDFENDRDPQLDRAFEVLGGSPLRPPETANDDAA